MFFLTADWLANGELLWLCVRRDAVTITMDGRYVIGCRFNAQTLPAEFYYKSHAHMRYTNNF